MLVSSICQNVTLLLHACAIEETYHDLLDYLICSKDNKDCMLQHCCQFPSNENLKKILARRIWGMEQRRWSNIQCMGNYRQDRT